jgi:hypothetical protein
MFFRFGGALLLSLSIGSVSCERAPRTLSTAVDSERAAQHDSGGKVIPGAPKYGADGGTAASAAKTADKPSEPAAGLPALELIWRFEQAPFGPTDVVISVPAAPSAETRFPVLVAFHGRGESLKGSRRGARGWLDDYLLSRASERLEHPPLVPADFETYVSAARLEQVNAALRAQPYAGLIVVCPYLPDVLQRDAAWAAGTALADFIADTLLPRVYAKTPALATAASTGVDGVSLGGRASLLVGFARPLAFGSVGALQAAMDASEVPRFAELGARARAQNPRLALRILTSDEDYFRNQNQALSAALSERGVAHGFALVMGTHSYQFNRGPGALEMLLYHSRVLRGQPAP